MAAAEAPVSTIAVEVVLLPAPHRVEHASLRLAPGATVADALRASGLLDGRPTAEVDALQPGIWGRACTLDTPLRDRDRVELYRPLQVDPKEARRQRYRRDGVRRAPRRG